MVVSVMVVLVVLLCEGGSGVSGGSGRRRRGRPVLKSRSGPHNKTRATVYDDLWSIIMCVKASLALMIIKLFMAALNRPWRTRSDYCTL